MAVCFTGTQKRRLTDLNCSYDELNFIFADENERNCIFAEKEKKAVKQNKQQLLELCAKKIKSNRESLEYDFESWLNENGFTKVITPTIITRKMLRKMTVDDSSELINQVFWLDDNKCLRPMLAPNLYSVMRDLQKDCGLPVCIYEIGSCFRKDSQGAKHLNEFTMLNMVKLGGIKKGEQLAELRKFAKEIMAALEIENYELVTESSTVYGETFDILIDGMEVASAAYGPHPLDSAWGIFDTWVGIGFGIERLLMAKYGYNNIKKTAKSLFYLNGIALKL